MAWQIEVSETAAKQLRKLGSVDAKRITQFLRLRLSNLENPRDVGKPLTGPFSDYWRYRVGDYRLICDIQDGILKVLVLQIANRREVYRR